jgi:hypothetical protein
VPYLAVRDTALRLHHVKRVYLDAQKIRRTAPASINDTDGEEVFSKFVSVLVAFVQMSDATAPRHLSYHAADFWLAHITQLEI